jgi:Alpha/beta hydrolase family
MTSRHDPAADRRARLIGDAAAGLSQLVLTSGAGITELAAELHAAIVRGPLVSAAHLVPDAIAAPLPYRMVAQSLSLLARLASAFPRRGDDGVAPDHWRRFVSALNGVVGDKLAEWNNPLAIPMRLRDGEGAALDAADWRAAARTGAVLFVHGLCTSELEWHTPSHRALASDLQAAGYSVGWLRYNSGRAVADNGADLADLLEAQGGQDEPAPALILIGHSMGGLVVRSACHWAAQRRHTWLRDLTHAAYLGTPHHGAPLERAGDAANALLGRTAYSAPFMRLGDIRSRGIKDLRFGCIAPDADDRRSIVPLPGHVRHLLVAAALQPPAGSSWIGDGLVPVHSALGQHPDGTPSLAAAQLERELLSPLGHIALMSDPRTCAVLRAWLALSSPQGHEDTKGFV